MSAASIQYDLLTFIEIFAAAIADANAMQTGIYYGEENAQALRNVGKTVHRYCVAFIGIMSLFLVFGQNIIASVYIREPGELFGYVAFASAFVGLSSVLHALVRSRIAYLNAIQNKWHMQIMTFLSSTVYTLLPAVVLTYLFGSYGVLASTLGRALLLAVTVYIYYAARNKTLIPSANQYMNLPEYFNRSPGDIIVLDIRDMDDVSLVAEQIQLFCKGHKIDERVSFKAAVCFEELSANIIQYGFVRCKKKPGIDLRVVISDRTLILHLRDNCPTFNVENQIALAIEQTLTDGGEASLGLRLVGELAENITYFHSLDNNNVIIRFPVGMEE